MPTSHFAQQVHQPTPWGLTMETCSYHQEGSVEKEPMFEKPLTPSDVGKLNRLVIPKQHAEKYFPMAGDSGEKGLLLNFEDEAGKAWRFRYSYWTSSQSYVLTKGWSRFVKEKKLDAGDIVLFERAMGEDRLYIGCRRRGSSGVAPAHSAAAHAATLPWGQAFYAAAGNPYNASPATPSYMYMSSMQQDCFFHRGEQIGSVVQNVAVPKRLRLFGVNLECMPDQSEQETVHSAQWFLDENPAHTERFMSS